jgi:hypothetical protein
MKKFKILTFLGITTIAFMLFLTAKTLNGQHSVSPMPKLITVTGSAEMSIVPDEVELSITIYSDRNNFEKYEKELTEICKKHGIPEAQLNFKNSLGHNEWYHWYWWWYYRNSSHLSQTYKLKINTKLDFLSLVKDMNKTWIQNISISSSSNKDLSDYRKEVKKEAMRMAKEKATYMLEAVGENIGSIVSVEEINADKKIQPNPAIEIVFLNEILFRNFSKGSERFLQRGRHESIAPSINSQKRDCGRKKADDESPKI